MSNNRLPIVLAHGIARFDILREILLNKLHIPETKLGDRLHYFKGIKSYLEANGFQVHHTNVDFAGPVDLRAQQLSDLISHILDGKTSDKGSVLKVD